MSNRSKHKDKYVSPGYFQLLLVRIFFNKTTDMYTVIFDKHDGYTVRIRRDYIVSRDLNKPYMYNADDIAITIHSDLDIRALDMIKALS